MFLSVFLILLQEVRVRTTTVQIWIPASCNTWIQLAGIEREYGYKLLHCISSSALVH